MEQPKKISVLENEITRLREKLDLTVDSSLMSSEKVLELSKELDVLIVGYYNLKSKFNT